MDEQEVGAASALSERHPQRVEDEVGAHVSCELPADDRAAVGVDHEREVDDAFPAAQVGEVGEPELVRPARGEVALDEVSRPNAFRFAKVVRHGLPRRFAPWMPLLRISRSTRPRPTGSPARNSAFHIRQEP